jgi:very-short-patch-repair endonuclease
MAPTPEIPSPARPICAHVWAPVQVSGRGEFEIARVAAAQRRHIRREQIEAAGLNRGAIAHRLRCGRLHRVHQSVFLVGPQCEQPLGAEMAAVLLFRGHAALSHWTAAALWGLIDLGPVEPHLTTCGRGIHRRPGLVLHQLALDPAEIRLHRGLPVTAPARTLIDIARGATSAELEQALATARVRGLVSEPALAAAIEQAGGRKGVALLRRIRDVGPAFTRSRAERQLLAVLRSAGLPAPIVNATLLGFEVDFLWPVHGLIVEFDGYASHGNRAAFERDRRRDQILIAAGYRVIRVTWIQLQSEPYAIVARIAQALIAR